VSADARLRHTANLRLRPLRSDDLDALIEVEGDPATNEHRPGGPPTDSEVEQHLRVFVEAWADGGVGYWAVGHGDEFVGVAGLRPLVLHGRDCWNLYYRFRPSAWGRGFAREVAIEAVAFAGEHSPRLPVVARTRPGNIAAKKVAQNAGLQRRTDLDCDGFEIFSYGW
jgi:ribosomal-protein-alanine N-acetyltransferase